MQMKYRPGCENTRVDALLRNPVTPPTDDPVPDVQVAQITSMDISQLLKVPPQQPSDRSQEEFGQEQSKDSELKRMMQFLKMGSLPDYIS